MPNRSRLYRIRGSGNGSLRVYGGIVVQASQPAARPDFRERLLILFVRMPWSRRDACVTVGLSANLRLLGVRGLFSVIKVLAANAAADALQFGKVKLRKIKK